MDSTSLLDHCGALPCVHVLINQVYASVSIESQVFTKDQEKDKDSHVH